MFDAILSLLLSRRGIWVNRLQAKLFSHGFFLALLGHECSQIEDQIPGLVGLDIVGERRHRSTIQAGHEDSVNVAIGVAALGTSALGKVVGRDRTAEIIGKSCGGRAVGLTEYAV